MAYQMTFERYELKYLLTSQKKEQMLRIMEPYMRLDDYGHTTIRNLYLDTSNFRLIRRSLEKPVYKEKIRLRSYQRSGPNDLIFVELKKKYKSIVYKRRLLLPQERVMKSFRDETPLSVDSQIGRELEYFRSYYGNLQPAIFLSYEREAYYALDGGDFRVTFDENILYRERELSLDSEVYGMPLLGKNQTLMEIKTFGGIPLWMSHGLSKLRLFPASFSKYGSAYQHRMEAKRRGGLCYA